MNITGNNNRLKKGICSDRTIYRCILIYTPIYIAMAVLAYYLFISNGKTLIRYTSYLDDPFSQRYMFVFELKRFLQNIFAGSEINTWDWSIGLGSDGYEFNAAALFLPSSYILVLTPEKYVDVVYSLTTVFRIWLSGVTFILFAKKCGLSSSQTIFGAVMYSFCPWAFDTTLLQGTFLKATILFPLIMLGEEKLIRRESPILFIASVGYTVLTFFLFSYMMAIAVFIYYVVRMLTLEPSNSIKTPAPDMLDPKTPRSPSDIIRTSVIFILSGIAGIMTAGIGFAVTVHKLSETTASTAKPTNLLWSLSEYLTIPLRLFDWDTVFESSSVIGIAAIGAVLIPLVIYRAWKRDTNAVMALILSVFILFPGASSMFNFFSYPSGRWMFIPAFFFTLAAASCIDNDLLKARRSKTVMTALFGLYIVYSIIMHKTLEPFRQAMLFTSCAAGLICLAVIWAFYREGSSAAGCANDSACSDKGAAASANNSACPQKAAVAVLLAVTCLGIVINCNLRIWSELEFYPEVGQVRDILYKSEEHVGPMIEDEGFYRLSKAKVDNVNEQLFFGNRSNYIFFSYVNSGWIRYNKLLGNSESYAYRVKMRGNDGRFGLEFLQGTKYFLTGRKKNEDLSRYAAYGFAPYEKIDGVDVLKNKYFIGSGCVYDSYIRESEWEKLSYADREIAMLMAAVVPDDASMLADMEELKAADIDSGVREIPYEIKADARKTSFTISAENDEDHHLLMSIENARAAGDALFRLKVQNGNVRKTLTNSRDYARGYPDIRDLTVNLGTGKRAGESIKIRLSGDEEAMAGGLDFDDIKLYSIPHSTYSKYAEALMDRRFVADTFDNDHIKGRISTEKGGILYLSVFDGLGWDIYIDGVKVKPMDQVNIAFTGAEVAPGEHEVELRYHTAGFWTGCILSLAGIILAAAIVFFHRKRGE